MKKIKNSAISLVISIICCIILIKINHDEAIRYLTSDGKTKALFGLVEQLCFGYKYYFLTLSALSFSLAILARKRRESQKIIIAAFIFCALSLMLIFVPIWKLMI